MAWVPHERGPGPLPSQPHCTSCLGPGLQGRITVNSARACAGVGGRPGCPVAWPVAALQLIVQRSLPVAAGCRRAADGRCSNSMRPHGPVGLPHGTRRRLAAQPRTAAPEPAARAPAPAACANHLRPIRDHSACRPASELTGGATVWRRISLPCCAAPASRRRRQKSQRPPSHTALLHPPALAPIVWFPAPSHRRSRHTARSPPPTRLPHSSGRTMAEAQRGTQAVKVFWLAGCMLAARGMEVQAAPGSAWGAARPLPRTRTAPGSWGQRNARGSAAVGGCASGRRQVAAAAPATVAGAHSAAAQPAPAPPAPASPHPYACARPPPACRGRAAGRQRKLPAPRLPRRFMQLCNAAALPHAGSAWPPRAALQVGLAQMLKGEPLGRTWGVPRAAGQQRRQRRRRHPSPHSSGREPAAAPPFQPPLVAPPQLPPDFPASPPCPAGGVIMDVVTPEEARIAEEAGAVAVMALERVPADIRRNGGVARMSDPQARAGALGAAWGAEGGRGPKEASWVLRPGCRRGGRGGTAPARRPAQPPADTGTPPSSPSCCSPDR